jgi:hypothetical protein
MKDSQLRELDAGQRVRAYASTRPADFAVGSRAAAVLAILVAAITDTEQHAAKQTAATLDRQENTEQKRTAINTMLRMMRAINLIARSINEQFPGIADQFKMGRGGDQDTINRARAFIVAATPISAEFIARGLPATFIADLQAAIDAVDQAEDRQSTARSTQATATAAIATALKQLRTAIRELDAIFNAKYHNDPATLAGWNAASHVEQAPKEKELTSPPSSPPSSPLK